MNTSTSTKPHAKRNPAHVFALAAIAALYVTVSAVGITWGLPTRAIDLYLFGSDEPWPGEKIYRLVGAEGKFVPTLGADVDLDPLDERPGEPVLVNATDKDAARIYLRYRLYTYQPDEMITMMALSGMDPGALKLDPRLYQYGGLFIYPVGALIGLFGTVGLIDVRPDVVYYLDHPGEFGKFYVVARAYSAAWGLLGVLVVFAIARRLAGPRAGILAALLLAIMPVVVCMAHEGKPHLPGAVLMLLAVYFGTRSVAPLLDKEGPGEVDEGGTYRFQPPRGNRTGDFWLMCICCGAALGMVINTWPIFVLIPVVAWQAGRCVNRPVIVRTICGGLTALAVYFATNPYVLINLFINRDVLRSNFGNSLAMYEVSRVFEGFARVLELTVEGATLPILVVGATALFIAAARSESRRENGAMIAVLAVPAAVFFAQFCLIGAGKPAEYGRFGIFPNTALAIGAACLLSRRWTTKGRGIVNWIPASFVVMWVAFFGAMYLSSFYRDTTADRSRRGIQFCNSTTHPETRAPTVAVPVEPAPYSCPPLNFARCDVWLVSDLQAIEQIGRFRSLVVEVLDDPTEKPVPQAPDPLFTHILRGGVELLGFQIYTPISWANKPIRIRQPHRKRGPIVDP